MRLAKAMLAAATRRGCGTLTCLKANGLSGEFQRSCCAKYYPARLYTATDSPHATSSHPSLSLPRLFNHSTSSP